MYTIIKLLGNVSREGYMRSMQKQLGNLGTISAFAYRHRETKKTQGNQEDTGKPRRHRETKKTNVSKFYYSIFIWSSTCFGRHTAHHQEPKSALAASGFAYVEGCWTCRWWTLSGTLCLTKYGFCTCAITFQKQSKRNEFQSGANTETFAGGVEGGLIMTKKSNLAEFKDHVADGVWL
jgi:hypothetical protein